jgi:hypothetical protein
LSTELFLIFGGKSTYGVDCAVNGLVSLSIGAGVSENLIGFLASGLLLKLVSDKLLHISKNISCIFYRKKEFKYFILIYNL